jgi:hypothetical protein
MDQPAQFIELHKTQLPQFAAFWEASQKYIEKKHVLSSFFVPFGFR